jgi:predicted glutamine amidotransferase
MCGLVGIAGNLQYSDEEIITNLLYFDYLRGRDSTGLATVLKSGEVGIGKLATDPITFFDSEKFKNILKGSLAKVFLGHNRFATRGAKNNYNAHPFQYGKIVGAHNGTLDKKSWDRLEETMGEKFPVDSMALINAIDALGIKEAIELCETGKDMHTGAWALTWYNSGDDTINFLRNEHRPLWVCFKKDGSKMYWASEWWMLQYAVEVIGKVELYAEKAGYKFFPLIEDTLYSFDLDDFKVNDKFKPVLKGVDCKGREPEPVVAQVPLSNLTGFHSTSPTSTTNGTTTTSHGKNKNKEEFVVNFRGDFVAPWAGYLSEEEFNDAARHGCSWCHKSMNYRDGGIIIYDGEGVILCPDAECSGLSSKNTLMQPPNRMYVTPTQFAILK